MDFLLFLLLNAVLFVRPAEIVPALLGMPIYEGVIIACLVSASPAVLEQLGPRSLARRPITLCVLGLAAAVVVSHLAHFDTYSAREYGLDFAKVVAFYLLLCGVVSTPRRLRAFLAALPVFAVVVTALAVLAYHGKIDIPDLEPLSETWADPDTGEEIVALRMRSTGIFNDPNDLCLLLVTSIVLSLYHLTNPAQRLLALLWLAPLALFGYGLMLTQSRGGFLALLAALAALIASRLPWRKSLPAAVVVLPLLFVLFGGRQTSLTTAEGTGQDRVQLWSEGLTLFHQAPLFGIGRGEYLEQVGMVAHNSFVHAYVELGLFGGTLFLGAFGLAAVALWRLRSRTFAILDPEVRRALPYVLAVVVGYAAGVLSLSRPYVVPTYLVFGLACVCGRVALAGNAAPVLAVSGRLAARLAVCSVAFLALTEVYVKIVTKWS